MTTCQCGPENACGACSIIVDGVWVKRGPVEEHYINLSPIQTCRHGTSVEVECWACYKDGIELEGGKYRFYYDEPSHKLYAERHGQGWRDFLGDNAVRMLFFSAVDSARKLGKYT